MTMDEPIRSIITSLDGHINDTDGAFGSTGPKEQA